MAMVCGTKLLLGPHLSMWLSRLNMFSSDGKSRSFADDTTGYGRGEGIATVVLKPLADALRDNDPIRAVIKGTGVNQDGMLGIQLLSWECSHLRTRSSQSPKQATRKASRCPIPRPSWI